MWSDCSGEGSESERDSFHSLPDIFNTSSSTDSLSGNLLLGFSGDTPIFESIDMAGVNVECEKSDKKRKLSEGNTSTGENESNTDLADKLGIAVQQALSSPSIIAQLKQALLPDVESAIKQHLDQVVEPVKFRLNNVEEKVGKHDELLDSLIKEKQKTATQQQMITTGKHNNLLISGLDETNEEITSHRVHDLAAKLDIRFADTFTADRIGKAVSGKSRPILVRFTSHWDKRKLYFQRMKLSKVGMTAVFINEDLMKDQSEIFYYTRRAKQDKLIKTTWSFNGSIFIKRLNGVDVLITSKDDLLRNLPGFDPSKYDKDVKK